MLRLEGNSKLFLSYIYMIAARGVMECSRRVAHENDAKNYAL